MYVSNNRMFSRNTEEVYTQSEQYTHYGSRKLYFLGSVLYMIDQTSFDWEDPPSKPVHMLQHVYDHQVSCKPIKLSVDPPSVSLGWQVVHS